VQQWLLSLGPAFIKYVQAFQEHGVNGLVLLRLSSQPEAFLSPSSSPSSSSSHSADYVLEEWLGVSHPLHRTRILLEVQQMQDSLRSEGEVETMRREAERQLQHLRLSLTELQQLKEQEEAKRVEAERKAQAMEQQQQQSHPCCFVLDPNIHHPSIMSS